MRYLFTRALAVAAIMAGTVAMPATPVFASTPQALGALRDRLAELAPVGSSAVVDPATGEVVVRVAGARSAAFSAAVARNRPVRTVSAPPVHSNALLMGGQAMDSMDGRPCTTTLVAKGGGGALFVVTAGHCLIGAQSPWWGPGGGLIGPVSSAYFPGDDFGLIRISDVTPYTPSRLVASALVAVANVTVGTPVCKTGRTTGTTCGTVLATNATWHYHEGPVYGLIETDVCAAMGDSGSPLISTRGGYGSRSQYGAFGILSGGQYSCGQPAYRSAFQPLPEVMSFYGLTLL